MSTDTLLKLGEFRTLSKLSIENMPEDKINITPTFKPISLKYDAWGYELFLMTKVKRRSEAPSINNGIVNASL